MVGAVSEPGGDDVSENVERFTGKRTRPTQHDKNDLRKFITEHAEKFEEFEAVCAGIVYVSDDGKFTTDWMVIPSAQLAALSGAVHFLAREIEDRIAET